MMKLLVLSLLFFFCPLGQGDGHKEGNVCDTETLASEVKALQQELAKEKDARDKLEKVVAEEIQHRKGELAAVKRDFATLQMLTKEDDASPIAFSVYTEDNFGPVTEYKKIPFPFVRVNIGGGWKPEEDAFQAPAAGYYYVFASIACVGGEHPHVRIMHRGGSIVAGLISTSSTIIGDANAAVLYLEEGDSVTVELSDQHNGVTYSSGARYTTFSGFRL